MAKKLKVLPLKFLGFLSLQGIIAVMKKDLFGAWNSLDFLGNVVERFYN
jgi:hypothetical protein